MKEILLSRLFFLVQYSLNLMSGRNRFLLTENQHRQIMNALSFLPTTLIVQVTSEYFAVPVGKCVKNDLIFSMLDHHDPV